MGHLKRCNFALFFGIASTTALSLSSPLEASWSSPTAVSASASDQLDLSIDSAGNGYAIWQGYDGDNYVIQTAILPHQGSWSSVVTLSDAGQDAQAPEIAVNASGNAVAIWSRFDGNYSVVQGAQQPAGQSWSSAVNISDSGANADSVELGMDKTGSNGSATVIWHRFNGNNFIVQASTLPPGESWSTAANLSASGQDSLIPYIAVNSAGNSVAIWARFDGSNFIVNGTSRLYELIWGGSASLSAAGETGYPANVSIDAFGNATAVWGHFDGSNYIVQVAILPFGLSWLTAINLSAAGQDAFTPLVVVNPFGNALLMWIRFDGSNYVLQTTSKPSSGSWSTVSTLSSSGRDVSYYNMAIDHAGNGVAVWDETDGTTSRVLAATYPANGSWTSSTQISTTNQFAYLPVCGVDPSGNAIALWLEWNGSIYVVTSATLPFGS